MRPAAHSLTFAVLLVVFSSSILAEDSVAQLGHGTQTGIFMLGIGTGSGTIKCTLCSHAGNMGGSAVTMQFGMKASPHLRMGFTADWWWHSRDTWERQLWDLTPAVLYYPATVERGFFIEGGPSYSMVLATVTDSTSLTRHGWGLAAGIGYDIAPQSVVSLTPILQYSYAWVGDIDYPLGGGIPFARGWKHSVVSLKLGVTFRERQK